VVVVVSVSVVSISVGCSVVYSVWVSDAVVSVVLVSLLNIVEFIAMYTPPKTNTKTTIKITMAYFMPFLGGSSRFFESWF